MIFNVLCFSFQKQIPPQEIEGYHPLNKVSPKIMTVNSEKKLKTTSMGAIGIPMQGGSAGVSIGDRHCWVSPSGTILYLQKTRTNAYQAAGTYRNELSWKLSGLMPGKMRGSPKHLRKT